MKKDFKLTENGELEITTTIPETKEVVIQKPDMLKRQRAFLQKQIDDFTARRDEVDSMLAKAQELQKAVK